MKTLILLLFLLVAAPAFAQHPAHIDVVASVKADLQRRGVSIVDGCGAFEIVKRVAWTLRSEGAGLLEKTGGNNCQGRAVDIIAFADGHIYDILIDSGGNNGPDWRDAGTVDPKLYQPAFDPGDTPPPVVVLPPVIPPATDLQATILAELRAHEAAEKAFRDSVKGAWDTWRPRLEAITKYVVGPIVAYIAAKKW